jgi:hypothetical protein
MADSTTFSTRSNAKRAAEKAIRDGAAPSIDYGIKPSANDRYRFEVVWLTKGGTAEVTTTEQIETEIADATVEAEEQPHADHDDDDPNAREDACPDLWPPGTRVQVALSKKRVRTGTIDYQVDHQHWRVILDGAPGDVSYLYRGNQLSATDAPAPEPKQKKERQARAQAVGRKSSRSADLDASAERGVMPEKPIVTSKANPHYQKRFDQLEKWSLADDWNAIRGYEVKGINSYAKIVKQYRDRLLAVTGVLATVS